MRYRNVRTGQVLERPTPDRWLEASSGWERVEDAAEAFREEVKRAAAALAAGDEAVTAFLRRDDDIERTNTE